MNGFLNFLFDINEGEPFRLKIESSDSKNNDFIDIIFITSSKGNFKFICINLDERNNVDKDINKLVEAFEKEKYINIILSNFNFDINGDDIFNVKTDDIIEDYLICNIK